MNPRKILQKYGLSPQKSLGQNFLVDVNLARRLVALSDLPPQATVIELGAGLGALTLALAEASERVIAYEIDKGLIKALKAEGLPDNVCLRQGDILKLDWADLARELDQKLIIFGNLPYYLTSPLLFSLLKARKHLSFCTFMVQKEVADRLLASPGSRKYGLLSVFLGVWAEIRALMNLSPRCFWPPPKVSSTAIKITFRLPDRRPKDEQWFMTLVKGAFSQRRKILANALKSLGIPRQKTEAALISLGLPVNIRPEALSPTDFVNLSEKLTPIFDQNGRV
ncbi:MAG TPA: ribosomal RNA small subunit methyltransferase A [Thermodesulfatator sp.]|nr:ribosomal RNA small subunit methyltransferase A [Thermodesulfatator sp.]